MAERGAYRPIKVVLLDGPDFQKLSPEARWTFVALKLSFGPSGIEVRYPGALEHELAAKTGYPFDSLSSGIQELENGGWIRRSGNVFWICGQLEHDPSLDVKNPHHRKSIQKHVSGLPRVGIVAEFIHENRDWFPPKEYSHPNGSTIPIPIGTSITEDRRPKTEDRRPNTEDRRPSGSRTRTREGPGSEESSIPARSEESSVHVEPTEPRPPDPPDPDDGLDDLARWLGEHATVLLDCHPFLRGKARSGLFQQFGPPGLASNAWRDDQGDPVAEAERPRLLALALTRYSTEGKERLVAAEFAGVLRRVIIDERSPSAKSNGKPLTRAQQVEYLRLRRELEAGGLDPDAAAERAMQEAGAA